VTDAAVGVLVMAKLGRARTGRGATEDGEASPPGDVGGHMRRRSTPFSISDRLGLG
jgi:hypothetical protein